jgi:predicted P-loop ATPase
MLASPWYTDEIADQGSKDAALQTQGAWIIEMAELDSVSRPDVSRIKSFMSRSTDRFRPPYGKHLITSPRQCVFAGTVNHTSYLRDETGGRRFWPVACNAIAVDALQRDRDQLSAEAVVRYRAGDSWWLDSEELNRRAASEQADRYEGDPWDEPIVNWLDDPRPAEVKNPYSGENDALEPFTSTCESVTIADVLRHCIGKRQEQWSQGDRIRVARVLRSLGYERYRASEGEKREWKYRRAIVPRRIGCPSLVPVVPVSSQ